MAACALRAAALASLAHLATSLGQNQNFRVAFHSHNRNQETAVADLYEGGSGLGNGRQSAAAKGFPPPDQIFRQYDRNADGKLTGEEVSGLLKSLGFTSEESEQMKVEMDRNQDSTVSPKEFKTYLMVPVNAEVAQTQEPAGEQVDPGTPPKEIQALASTKRAVAAPIIDAPQRPQAPSNQVQPQVNGAVPVIAGSGTPDAAETESTANVSETTAAGQQATTALPTKREASPPPAAAGAEVAPFGKEDTAQELQLHSAKTQDTLIDAIENAEVAELKRSVFRSLARLRAATMKEFDTIARLETQAIDEYNDNHHYRSENPPEHLSGGEPAVQADKQAAFH